MKNISLAIAIATLSCPYSSFARDYFNPALLENNRPEIKGIDLSSFENGTQSSGKYRVDVVLNNELVDTKDIYFSTDKAGELYPCLSLAFLKTMGVLVERYPELTESNGCVNFKVIPQATSHYDLASQELQLSIPQAALSPKLRGYVDPSSWDEGIAAFLLNYDFTGDQTKSDMGRTTQSQYGRLLPGINIGPWRLRNYSTWNHDENSGNNFESLYTYLQRDVQALKSQLTIGDSNTSSDIFDNVPFRGVQLASDENMKPDSLRGYAPVVRGIAKSNSQVVIRQNGYIIYQSYVPAGAFEINDLYPTGQGGDLNVTVKEQDGHTQEFVVPYASLPLLQREKSLKYSVTGAKYRPYSSDVEQAPFVQATAIYGLPWGITVYGGLQNSSHYEAVAMGLGRNFGQIGAFSADVTAAKAQVNTIGQASGRSFRVRYSKDFVDTGTNFAIAGYRYSTRGFYTLQEALDSYGDDNSLTDRRRNRAEISLSQSLGASLGSLTGSAIQEKYWNNNESLKSYSLSYSNSLAGMNYSISYSFNKNTSDSEGGGDSYNEETIMFNLNIPLAKFLPDTWATYNFNGSKHGGNAQTVGLTGTALADNNLNWNLQQSKSSEGMSGSALVDYRGALAETNLGYSYSPDTKQVNYGLSGGVVLHEGGITLSQPLGDTVAIIEAKDAKGASIYNQSGAAIDRFGYAVISNLTPYHKNDIALDPSTFDDNIEIEDNGVTVIPTKGAVVKATFNSHYGFKSLVTLKIGSGYVPFGAMVDASDAEDSEERGFIVGDMGQVYISGLKQKEGTLHVRWGNDTASSCNAHYKLSGEPGAGSIYKISEKCE